MKKIVVILLIMGTIFNLCSCKKEEKKEEPTSPPKIEVIMPTGEIVSTSTPKPVETDAPNKSTLNKYGIPKIENNLADVTDLSMIVLNNYEIDIDNDLTYEDFLLSTHFKKINYATVDIDCLQYKFNSKMYGVIKGNSPLSGSGTSIGAIFTHNGKLIEYDTESEYNPKELILKGIHIDKFFEKDDFHITMYGGIGVGTSEDKVTALLGSGVMSDQYRIYRNNNTTAIFEFNDCVVEEIVIFNN